MRTVAMIAVVVCLGGLWAPSAEARARRRSETDPRLAAGLRMHAEQKKFTKLPYKNGDLSYWLAYEFHEQTSFLQLGVGYAPSVGGTTQSDEDIAVEGLRRIDYVVTPQISMIWKDQAWRGGVGVLKSLIAGDDESDWTGFYWQLMLGLNLPISATGLDVMAYYVFDRWQDLPNFRGDSMDFGVSIAFSF